MIFSAVHSYIIFILSLLSPCSLIDISCKYETKIFFLKLNSVYCCDVQKNLNIISPQINTKIIPSGSHASGKSGKSVDCIYADNKGIQYLPNGLEIVFGDLKVMGFVMGESKT